MIVCMASDGFLVKILEKSLFHFLCEHPGWSVSSDFELKNLAQNITKRRILITIRTWRYLPFTLENKPEYQAIKMEAKK